MAGERYVDALLGEWVCRTLHRAEQRTQGGCKRVETTADAIKQEMHRCLCKMEAVGRDGGHAPAERMVYVLVSVDERAEQGE
jgi:hypothetical protein